MMGYFQNSYILAELRVSSTAKTKPYLTKSGIPKGASLKMMQFEHKPYSVAQTVAELQQLSQNQLYWTYTSQGSQNILPIDDICLDTPPSQKLKKMTMGYFQGSYI